MLIQITLIVLLVIGTLEIAKDVLGFFITNQTELKWTVRLARALIVLMLSRYWYRCFQISKLTDSSLEIGLIFT
jgi:hypothetical protein